MRKEGTGVASTTVDKNPQQSRRGEKKKEDLYNNLTVKCTLMDVEKGEVVVMTDRDDIRVCGTCDACQLHYYVTRTTDWFSRCV